MPHLARENTLRAFALALDAGADAIELDVHCSADGVPVVHHDAELADGTPITSLPAAVIAAREPSPDDGVPTLASACALVGDRATLFVEAKGTGIEREVLAVLRRHEGVVAIHSFDHDLIRRIRRLDATMRLGVLLDEGSSWSDDAIVDVMTSAGALDVWPHHSLAGAALVECVHRRGGRVLVWTVNDAAQAIRLARLGADGLCSDDVRLLPGGTEASLAADRAAK